MHAIGPLLTGLQNSYFNNAVQNIFQKIRCSQRTPFSSLEKSFVCLCAQHGDFLEQMRSQQSAKCFQLFRCPDGAFFLLSPSQCPGKQQLVATKVATVSLRVAHKVAFVRVE